MYLAHLLPRYAIWSNHITNNRTKSKRWITVHKANLTILRALFFTPRLVLKGTRGIKESLVGWNQNEAGGGRFHDDPKSSLKHVLLWDAWTVPSCSKIQARYITLHLSCQTHWTHADVGSVEVVRCISNTMPHSFGIHQSPDDGQEESVSKVCLFLSAISNVLIPTLQTK